MTFVILFLGAILFLSYGQRSDAAQAIPAWQQEWEKTLDSRQERRTSHGLHQRL